MDTEKDKETWLTLKEIEDVCNEYVQRNYPEQSIRSKYRFLREPLICRYIYYFIARSQKKPEKHVLYRNKHPDGLMRNNPHTIQSTHAHSLIETGKRIGFDHATVIHGIKALETLIVSKNKIALEAYAEISSTCEKLLLTKKNVNELDQATKRLLAGAV